mmetsp:Transcript_9855/g.15781  ORF Transcript_9855/g.15781 Transcript_9855/m.15781 type:complete len:266 (+) Transcript_9855:39-836(+)
MAEQKEQQPQEEDDYDGPWIEKRIEWKCPDRKRHNVVLFGSWNRFKGGDELEYQGKQIFACNVKLPLGNYVYRFLIDGEEWETDNKAPKTARNGIEYNQIHVTEDSDEEEEDEFDQGDDEAGDAEQGGNTALIIGADGKMTVGKKRRGRPSVELDLGQNFASGAEAEAEAEEDAEEADEAVEEGNDADEDTSATAGDTAGGDEDGKKKKKKKKAATTDASNANDDPFNTEDFGDFADFAQADGAADNANNNNDGGGGDDGWATFD